MRGSWFHTSDSGESTPQYECRSHDLLRGTVPGQINWDSAVTSAANGDVGGALLFFGATVLEQGLFALTLGLSGPSTVAVKSGGAAVAGASKQVVTAATATEGALPAVGGKLPNADSFLRKGTKYITGCSAAKTRSDRFSLPFHPKAVHSLRRHLLCHQATRPRSFKRFSFRVVRRSYDPGPCPSLLGAVCMAEQNSLNC